MPTDNKVDRIARELEAIAPSLNLRERRRHAKLIEAALDAAWSARTARTSVTACLRAAVQLPATDDQIHDLALRIIATCGHRQWAIRGDSTASALVWRRWLADPAERFRLLSRRIVAQLPHLELADAEDVARALAGIDPGAQRTRIDIRTGDYTTGRQVGEIVGDYFTGPDLDGGGTFTVTLGINGDPEHDLRDIASRFAQADQQGRSVMLRVDGAPSETAIRAALRVAARHAQVPCIVVSADPVEGKSSAILDIPAPTPEGVVRLLQSQLVDIGAAPVELDESAADTALALAKALPASLWSPSGSGQLFVRSVARRIAESSAGTSAGAEQVRAAFDTESSQWRIPLPLDEVGRRKALSDKLTEVLTAHSPATIEAVATSAAQIDPIGERQRLVIVGPRGSGRTATGRAISWEIARMRGERAGAVVSIGAIPPTANDADTASQAVRIRSAFIAAHRGSGVVFVDDIDALTSDQFDDTAVTTLSRMLDEHPNVPVVLAGTVTGLESAAAAVPALAETDATAELPSLTAAGAQAQLIGLLSAKSRRRTDALLTVAAAYVLHEELNAWTPQDFDAAGNARGISELAEDIVRRQIVDAFDNGGAQWPIDVNAVRGGIDDLVHRSGLPGRWA